MEFTGNNFICEVLPALLAGNTVVLKPSPFTPLTVLRISDYINDLLPPGVFNVVTGGDDLGPWMTSHPGIDLLIPTIAAFYPVPAAPVTDILLTSAHMYWSGSFRAQDPSMHPMNFTVGRYPRCK
jgi:hypothetical protein